MQQKNTTTDLIDNYFRDNHQELLSEKNVVSELVDELAQAKKTVSNKEIISALIHKLDVEHDVVKLDIYRAALEIVLQATPDD